MFISAHNRQLAALVCSNINDDHKTQIKPRIISPQSFATFFPKLTSTQKPCESPSYSCIHYSISSKFITTIPWIIQIFWFRRSHSLEFLPLNPVTSPYSCVLGFNRPSIQQAAEFLALYRCLAVLERYEAPSPQQSRVSRQPLAV